MYIIEEDIRRSSQKYLGLQPSGAKNEHVLQILCSLHMEELKKITTHGVERRHREQFVGWFERKVSNFVNWMLTENSYCLYLFCCFQIDCR